MCYREWKEKSEMIDYENDDSITFFMKNTWFDNKEKTLPLTGDEIVIIPNPILVVRVFPFSLTSFHRVSTCNNNNNFCRD